MNTVQFYMPRSVAEALPIQAIAPEARRAGIEGATLQYSNTRWRPAETLVTGQMLAAQHLPERLRHLRREAAALLLEQAKQAVDALEAAIAPP